MLAVTSNEQFAPGARLPPLKDKLLGPVIALPVPQGSVGRLPVEVIVEITLDRLCENAILDAAGELALLLIV
ncbi:hypothetical protein MACH26_31230 [Planctobacterium marinum]|uniref:Uncharacterized protein n=1 Tax=Planctobacterium marinum TaxID=1631968 RepID=A0AA48HRX8_9ALTE|nr:hypothetical protein MACH26_31230 [Planctobacterium marinum]